MYKHVWHIKLKGRFWSIWILQFQFFYLKGKYFCFYESKKWLIKQIIFRQFKKKLDQFLCNIIHLERGIVFFIRLFLLFGETSFGVDWLCQSFPWLHQAMCNQRLPYGLHTLLVGTIARISQTRPLILQKFKLRLCKWVQLKSYLIF